jgi:1,4-dihydroxy-2-naphthoate octaprenyltransferase/chlorophyll synthase
MRPLSRSRRWWLALKPASWPKLLVPALLGQSLGAAAATAVDLRALGLGALYLLGLLAFIVLLNDWGDREVDAIKRRMFPDGCSPKTIPDGILPASQLLLAGLAAGGVALAAAAVAQLWIPRPRALLFAASGLAVFLAYTFPPLRLNYRGGGELLEALGVGLLLPWFESYLQSGQARHGAHVLLAGFALMSLGSALASGLSDEQSDREGGKRTVTTLLGNRATRRLTEACLAAGALAWLAAGLLSPAIRSWVVLPPLALVAWNGIALRAISDRAVTNAFPAQGLYKRILHRAIWQGTSLLALLHAAAAFLY